MAGIDTQLLEAAVANMPDDRLQAMRHAGQAHFSVSNFPTERDEAWKYTNLLEAAELSNAWLSQFATGASLRSAEAAGDAAALTAEADRIQHAVDAHWIVIRNGIADPANIEGARRDLGATVTVKLLSDPETASDSAGQAPLRDPLSALNAALLKDGLEVTAHVANDTDKPIGLMFLDSPADLLTQSRVHVNVQENASLRLVCCQLSARAGAQFSNSVFASHVAADGRLEQVEVQLRDAEHIGAGRRQVTVEAGGHYRHSCFDFGGKTSRNDIHVDLAGAGARADVAGLYLAGNGQHIDNHICASHRVGPTQSSQNFRGIIGGNGRCVFNGKAYVAKGADGTDASQDNHNLLLSDKAEINTKPELEIYADEVKCSHGATVGQLDDDALFYLRARGLDEQAASQLLTQAFAREISSGVAIEQCREWLDQLIAERLDKIVNHELQSGKDGHE